MAKRQRGKTADGEAEAADFRLTLDSSDEAPEEVTFEDAKDQALRSMREALDTGRRDREVLKEKRRRRQQLFREQKERRLLSAQVLEELGSSSKTLRPSGEAAEQEQQQQEEEEDGRRKKKEKRKKRMQSQKLKGNYVVTTTKARALASYQLQAAKEFVHSRLYGPEICRTTSHELLTLQNKKGRNKSAAVQFVRKNWAAKEKAEAEKQRKRWVHRQRVLPC